jgi:predicted nucleotidyltransferase component of viral defense system
MKKKLIRDLPHSVHQRLLNLDPGRSEDFTLRLTRYALERLLYRISSSPFTDRFVLKGAMVFLAWGEKTWRPTRDLDLLGPEGLSSAELREIFSSICRAPVEDDGLQFVVESIEISPIREDQETRGHRLEMLALMKKIRIKVQVDIGEGDVAFPKPDLIEYPTLLDFPAPHIRVYRPETVVAEKLEAMIKLDMANSRMKDFYDLTVISRKFSFRGVGLARAIKEVFMLRGLIPGPGSPTALNPEFGNDKVKRTQWRAFLSRIVHSDDEKDFEKVIHELRRFLLPLVEAVRDGISFTGKWPPGGPWERD